jgi:hypothetical protein
VSLAEIKSAVRELSPKELAELAAFIVDQDNIAWDKQMDTNAEAGKLDFLIEQADRAEATGKLRDWPADQ